MNNKMITIPYADAIEYGENTSALFKALWELTDLIRLESDLKKHHRAYLHVREDIDEKVKEARQIMTKVSVDEQASREYINQMWAEAMEIYRSGNFRLRFSPAMNDYLKAHQKDFMPEDTKAGQILDYLERYSGSMVCSKQLYKEALGHDYDEPKQWELREINDIMNNAVTGWRAFSNPRYFPEPYRRQKGWERIRNDNEPDNSMDGFQEIPTEEMEQLGLPEEWLKQK